MTLIMEEQHLMEEDLLLVQMGKEGDTWVVEEFKPKVEWELKTTFIRAKI